MHPFSLSHGLLSSSPHGNCCFSNDFIPFLTAWQLLLVFAWQLLSRPNGNSYCTYMATAIFSIGLCAHPIPSFEIAFLADQTFLSFFKLASMATLAGFAWQLLTMPHGNSYSTYMATTSFSTYFSFFLDFYHGKYFLFIS